MTVKRNEFVDMACAVFGEYGIIPTIEYGKHVKLRAIRGDGRPIMVVVSATPSDKRRAIQRVKSDVRKALRYEATVH